MAIDLNLLSGLLPKKQGPLGEIKDTWRYDVQPFLEQMPAFLPERGIVPSVYSGLIKGVTAGNITPEFDPETMSEEVFHKGSDLLGMFGTMFVGGAGVKTLTKGFSAAKSGSKIISGLANAAKIQAIPSMLYGFAMDTDRDVGSSEDFTQRLMNAGQFAAMYYLFGTLTNKITKPMLDKMITSVIKKASGPSYEAGFIRQWSNNLISSVPIMGGFGLLEGETVEERLRNATIGMGAGVLSSGISGLISYKGIHKARRMDKYRTDLASAWAAMENARTGGKISAADVLKRVEVDPKTGEILKDPLTKHPILTVDKDIRTIMSSKTPEEEQQALKRVIDAMKGVGGKGKIYNVDKNAPVGDVEVVEGKGKRKGRGKATSVDKNKGKVGRDKEGKVANQEVDEIIKSVMKETKSSYETALRLVEHGEIVENATARKVDVNNVAEVKKSAEKVIKYYQVLMKLTSQLPKDDEPYLAHLEYIKSTKSTAPEDPLGIGYRQPQVEYKNQLKLISYRIDDLALKSKNSQQLKSDLSKNQVTKVRADKGGKVTKLERQFKKVVLDELDKAPSHDKIYLAKISRSKKSFGLKNPKADVGELGELDGVSINKGEVMLGFASEQEAVKFAADNEGVVVAINLDEAYSLKSGTFEPINERAGFKRIPINAQIQSSVGINTKHYTDILYVEGKTNPIAKNFALQLAEKNKIQIRAVEYPTQGDVSNDFFSSVELSRLKLGLSSEEILRMKKGMSVDVDHNSSTVSVRSEKGEVTTGVSDTDIMAGNILHKGFKLVTGDPKKVEADLRKQSDAIREMIRATFGKEIDDPTLPPSVVKQFNEVQEHIEMVQNLRNDPSWENIVKSFRTENTTLDIPKTLSMLKNKFPFIEFPFLKVDAKGNYYLDKSMNADVSIDNFNLHKVLSRGPALSVHDIPKARKPLTEKEIITLPERDISLDQIADTIINRVNIKGQKALIDISNNPFDVIIDILKSSPRGQGRRTAVDLKLITILEMQKDVWGDKFSFGVREGAETAPAAAQKPAAKPVKEWSNAELKEFDKKESKLLKRLEVLKGLVAKPTRKKISKRTMTRISKLEREHADLLNLYSKGHSKVKALSKKIDALRGSRARIQTGITEEEKEINNILKEIAHIRNLRQPGQPQQQESFEKEGIESFERELISIQDHITQLVAHGKFNYAALLRMKQVLRNKILGYKDVLGSIAIDPNALRTYSDMRVEFLKGKENIAQQVTADKMQQALMDILKGWGKYNIAFRVRSENRNDLPLGDIYLMYKARRNFAGERYITGEMEYPRYDSKGKRLTVGLTPQDYARKQTYNDRLSAYERIEKALSLFSFLEEHGDKNSSEGFSKTVHMMYRKYLSQATRFPNWDKGGEANFPKSKSGDPKSVGAAEAGFQPVTRMDYNLNIKEPIELTSVKGDVIKVDPHKNLMMSLQKEGAKISAYVIDGQTFEIGIEEFPKLFQLNPEAKVGYDGMVSSLKGSWKGYNPQLASLYAIRPATQNDVITAQNISEARADNIIDNKRAEAVSNAVTFERAMRKIITDQYIKQDFLMSGQEPASRKKYFTAMTGALEEFYFENPGDQPRLTELGRKKLAKGKELYLDQLPAELRQFVFEQGTQYREMLELQADRGLVKSLKGSLGKYRNQGYYHGYYYGTKGAEKGQIIGGRKGRGIVTSPHKRKKLTFEQALAREDLDVGVNPTAAFERYLENTSSSLLHADIADGLGHTFSPEGRPLLVYKHSYRKSGITKQQFRDLYEEIDIPQFSRYGGDNARVLKDFSDGLDPEVGKALAKNKKGDLARWLTSLHGFKAPGNLYKNYTGIKNFNKMLNLLVPVGPFWNIYNSLMYTSGPVATAKRMLGFTNYKNVEVLLFEAAKAGLNVKGSNIAEHYYKMFSDDLGGTYAKYNADKTFRQNFDELGFKEFFRRGIMDQFGLREAIFKNVHLATAHAWEVKKAELIRGGMDSKKAGITAARIMNSIGNLPEREIFSDSVAKFLNVTFFARNNQAQVWRQLAGAVGLTTTPIGRKIMTKMGGKGEQLLGWGISSLDAEGQSAVQKAFIKQYALQLFGSMVLFGSFTKMTSDIWPWEREDKTKMFHVGTGVKDKQGNEVLVQLPLFKDLRDTAQLFQTKGKAFMGQRYLINKADPTLKAAISLVTNSVAMAGSSKPLVDPDTKESAISQLLKKTLTDIPLGRTATSAAGVFFPGARDIADSASFYPKENWEHLSDLLGFRTDRGYGGVGEEANKMSRMRDAMKMYQAESNRVGDLMDRAWMRDDHQAVNELAKMRWQDPQSYKTFYKQWVMKKQQPLEYYKMRLPMALRGSF